MVPHGAVSLFCGTVPAGERSRLSVKDVLKLVTVLICLLARGPGREKGRTSNGIVLHKTGSSHIMEMELMS